MDDPNLMDQQPAGANGQQPQQPGVPFQPNNGPIFYGAPPGAQPHGFPPSEALFAHLFEQQQAFANQLVAQQQEFMRQQQEMFRQAMASINVHMPPNPEIILDSLANNIKEFRFDPEENITFAGWYARYDDLFLKDAMRLDDEAKVRLLLRNLGTSEHERYVSFILPKHPKEFTFEETVKKLKALFGTTESDVSKRYRCLQMSKLATEDYVTYACRINKACVEFELRKLSEEQFKCLSFVCGLKAEEDAEVRTRLLSKIEEAKEVTLEQLSEACQRLLNLKRDTAMIESSSSSTAAVHQVKQKQSFPKQPPKTGETEKGPNRMQHKPPSPCWYCGAMHFVRDCNYSNHICSDCGETGHREGYCDSAYKNKKPSNRKNSPDRYSTNSVSVTSHSTNKLRPIVQAKLNGVGVQFMLDTGSDVSVIGRSIWEQIGKPPTQPANAEIFTASGDLLVLLFKFCCAVDINGKQRYAQFFVVEDSLQLMGLDVLDGFELLSAPINTFCTMVSDTMKQTDLFYDGKRSLSVPGHPDDPQSCKKPMLNYSGGEKVNKSCFLLTANQNFPTQSDFWLSTISVSVSDTSLAQRSIPLSMNWNNSSDSVVKQDTGQGGQAIVNQQNSGQSHQYLFKRDVSNDLCSPSSAALPCECYLLKDYVIPSADL